MTGALIAAVAAVAVAWLGWCWVLVQREDADARMRLADATRAGEQYRATLSELGDAVTRLRTEHAAVVARLDDAERRLQSTIARVGMR